MIRVFGMSGFLSGVGGAFLLLAPAAFPDEDGTRLLWDTGLLAKRPAGKSAAARPPIKYRPVAASVREAKPAVAATSPLRPEDAILGITFWRLRPSIPGDDPNARLLVLEDGATGEIQFTPERIEADAPLTNGDRVRLTIEVPRGGYLYVLDREQFSDGTTGPAYLIYPNWQTRQGDNAVAAGRLIEIPDQRDRPNHFRVRRSRPDQSGEQLSVFVTPKPLDLKITRKPIEISDAQVAEWEQKFAVTGERFELEGGAGQTYTAAEKQAGSDRSALLTREDAAPQTLYRVQARAGEPMLLRLPIRLKP